MEVEMEPLQKQMLDDVFDAFSMLAGGNIVNLMHVQGGVTRWSPSAVELFDLPGEYIPNGAFNWAEYVHPEDRKRYLDVMIPLANGDRFAYDLSYRVRTKGGEYATFRVIGSVLRNSEGRPSLIGGMMVNEGLMENTDPITVLRNKYSFFDALNALMKEERSAVALLLGVSKLSQINETYGYSYGNRILQETAWLIQESLGERGGVYRMDDAAFAVLSSSLTQQEVAALYDGLRLKLLRGIRVDGVRHSLSANGGMISLRGVRMEPVSVYSCLCYAYNESKNRQHGELVDFNGSANYNARESLEMINVVRDCIIENCKGFYVKYQPVYNAKTERPIGVESLLRWRGEPYGEVLPMAFLPVLEKDFIFEELGGWLQRRVLSDGARFLESDPDFLVGLNISATQLEDEYFMEGLFLSLEETGFPPQNLCLELTKSCRLLEIDRLKSIVEGLRARGIRILIDDFGTGVDSLAFLKALSPDLVKLDLSLAENPVESEEDRRTIEYLTGLAAVRGTNVCVKGVKTAEIHQLLKRYPIGSMQGNYYSEPLSAEEMNALSASGGKTPETP